MIADLKPYAEYKESGLPWLGRVPGHWDLRRMKSAVANVIEQTSDMEPNHVYIALEHVESWTGRARPQRDTELFTGQVKRFREGDVLFGKLRPYLAKVTRIASAGVCAGEFFVLRPTDPGLLAPYLEHHLRAKQTIDVINGSTFGAKMPRADWQFCGNLPIPLPPPAEQAAIVRFLDWASGRLERAIRAKRKVIALLNEQKQAIIHRAVTRGLDPSVPLKPSGIPWLGDIPQHWEVAAIGAAATLIQTGPFGSQLHSHEYVIAGVPVINPSHMADGRLNPSPAVTISEEKARELSRHMLCPGDIVIARRGELGRCALVTPLEQGWICGTGSLLLRCRTSTVSPEFFQVVFASRGIADMLSLSSIGATMANLNAGTVARQRLPLPPIEEQQRIVRFIEDETRSVEIAISRLEREIELLREYRTRLVADVVTGKLDVREAAARLPEEAPLDGVEDDADLGDEAESADEEAAV